MPTAIVTGATRGLGRALAFDLARQGVTVYGTGLNHDRLDALEVGDLPFHPVRADVSSEASNAALAERVRGTGLDILVHNAGVLGSRVPLAHTRKDEFERVLAVNTTGVFDLTAKVAHLLNPGARLIFVSSGVGNQARANWGAYCVSKNALEAIAGIYAKELHDARVYVVDPGGMRTEMRAAAYPDEDPMTLVTPEQNLGVFRWLLAPDCMAPSGSRHLAKDHR